MPAGGQFLLKDFFSQDYLVYSLHSMTVYFYLSACLTADPGVASLIPARYHTFVEIDH